MLFCSLLAITFLVSIKGEIKANWFGKAPSCDGENICKNIGFKVISKSKVGDGHLCFSGYKAACLPEQEPINSFIDFKWYGFAPFCEGERMCKDLGLHVISHSKSGDGYFCITGTKALCGPEEDVEPIENDPNYDIKLVNYNINEQPSLQCKSKACCDAFKDNQRLYDGHVERTCRIPQMFEASLRHVDVISLFGVYSQGCMDQMNLKDLFEYFDWRYSSYELSNEYFANSGIKVFSKYPFLSESWGKFENNSSSETSALNSYHIGQFEKEGKEYYIVTAEFEMNDEKIAEKQAEQLAKVFYHLIKSKTAPLIFQSNMDASNNMELVTKIEKILNMSRFQTQGQDSPYSPSENDLAKDSEPKWDAYTGYSKKHGRPKRSITKVIKLTSQKPFTFNRKKYGFCQFKSDEEEKEITTSQLSDHFPVITSIKF